MKSKLLLVALALLLPARVHAQDAAATQGIEVTAAFTEADLAANYKSMILNEFERQLRLRGIAETGRYQKTWFLQTLRSEEADGPRMIVSITRMQRLPEEVIELGADHEAFYLRQTPIDLPAEGKTVRQSFSRDWMKHFHEIVDVDILVFRPSEMEQAISDYIDRLRSA